MDTVISSGAADVAALSRIKSQYPDWRIWRSRGPCAAWYASKRAGAPEECAPTLAADTLPALEEQLADPPMRYGRPFATTGAHP